MTTSPSGSDAAQIDPAACPHCGAKEVGGEDGCNELFQEVVGREFSRPELFQVYRLTVDAYSLQHPDLMRMGVWEDEVETHMRRLE
jgi:hypothetical protein